MYLPRPRYSLRALLAAFSAAAIALPIWYRWPYTETEVFSRPGSKQVAKHMTTWRREWGGGRTKHGLETFAINDQVVRMMNWQEGLEHGLYRENTDGRKGWDVEGRYESGKKVGTWIDRRYDSERTSVWQGGKLDGPYEIDRKGNVTTARFGAGRLVELNGKPTASRLWDLLESGQIDDRVARELRLNARLEVINTPLRDTAQILQDIHQVPIVLDPILGNNDYPVTLEIDELDLCSTITLIANELGLACDYRFGCVWFTTQADSRDWQDLTNIEGIDPPKGSLLDTLWNEPVPRMIEEMPLRSALEELERLAPIDFDASAIASEPALLEKVSCLEQGLSLKNVLGVLLDRANCRCERREDAIVILRNIGD